MKVIERTISRKRKQKYAIERTIFTNGRQKEQGENLTFVTF
jgi:hypothetical protein